MTRKSNYLSYDYHYIVWVNLSAMDIVLEVYWWKNICSRCSLIIYNNLRQIFQKKKRKTKKHHCDLVIFSFIPSGKAIYTQSLLQRDLWILSLHSASLKPPQFTYIIFIHSQSFIHTSWVYLEPAWWPAPIWLVSSERRRRRRIDR